MSDPPPPTHTHPPLPCRETFYSWAESLQPGARSMNISSDAQNARLLFAPCERVRNPWSKRRSAVSVVQSESTPAPPPTPPLAASAGGASRRKKSDAGEPVLETAPVLEPTPEPQLEGPAATSKRRKARVIPSDAAATSSPAVEDAAQQQQQQPSSEEKDHPLMAGRIHGSAPSTTRPATAAAAASKSRRSFASWAAPLAWASAAAASVRFLLPRASRRRREGASLAGGAHFFSSRGTVGDGNGTSATDAGSRTGEAAVAPDVSLVGKRPRAGSKPRTRQPKAPADSPPDEPSAAAANDGGPLPSSSADSGSLSDGSSTDAGGLNLRTPDTDADSVYFVSGTELESEEEQQPPPASATKSKRGAASAARGAAAAAPAAPLTYAEHAPIIAAEVAAMDAAEAAAAAGGAEPPPRDADRWPAYHTFKVANTEGVIEPGRKVARATRDVRITGLGLPVVARTDSGGPAANSAVLKALAGGQKPGDPPGRAHAYFGGGETGARACAALHALYTVSTIDTMLSNFIVPLQTMTDAQSRIHCSM